MIKKIPEHIFWPGMVFAILGMSVIANMVLLYKASNDGGAQIIENYYDKAAHWDETKAKASESSSLGWATQIEVTGSGSHRVVVVRIADPNGPVTSLKPTVTLRDPTLIDPVASAEMVLTGDTYVATIPFPRNGLWDVQIQAEHQGIAFDHTQRLDVRNP